MHDMGLIFYGLELLSDWMSKNKQAAGEYTNIGQTWLAKITRAACPGLFAIVAIRCLNSVGF